MSTIEKANWHPNGDKMNTVFNLSPFFIFQDMANAEYRVDLCTDDLKRIVQIADFTYLEVTISASNEPSVLTMRLPTRYAEKLIEIGLLPSAENPCILGSCFTLKVYRRVNCGNWYLVGCTVFFINSPGRVLGEDKTQYIELEAESAMGLLKGRIVSTHSEDPLSQFENVPTDTALHTLFTNMFGAALPPATRDWIGSGLVADGEMCNDPSIMSTFTQNGAWKNVYDLMTEMVENAKGQCEDFFFDLTPTKMPIDGGEQPSLPLLFNTYCGHRGVDRTLGNEGGNSAVILSPNRGTIKGIEYKPDFTEGASVAYGVGDGDGAGTPTAVAMDDMRINACLWGHKETVKSDSNATTADDAQTVANAALSEANPQAAFELAIQCTESVAYGNPDSGGAHWWFGDCLTIFWRTNDSCLPTDGQQLQLDVRNTSINMVVENWQETIKANFELIGCEVCSPNLPPDPG